MSRLREEKSLGLAAPAAILLFLPLFYFRRLGPLDFWWWMSLNVFLLSSLAVFLEPTLFSFLAKDLRSGRGQKLFLGLFSAALFYLVFLAGKRLLGTLFPGSEGAIEKIYGFKEGAGGFRVGLLLGFIIGPGEELFWRGFLQRLAQRSLGNGAGWVLVAGLYSLVHVGSSNPVLVLAAALGGLFWGGLFLLWNSVWLVIVSHTVWDLFIFVFFPLSQQPRP